MQVTRNLTRPIFSRSHLDVSLKYVFVCSVGVFAIFWVYFTCDSVVKKIMQTMITLVMGSILEIYDPFRLFFKKNMINNMTLVPK